METNNNTAVEPPTVAPKKSMVGKLWILVVLLAGLAVGILLSDVATGELSRTFFLRGFPLNPDPRIQLHIVLTTMEVAMLVALVVVYTKVYNETRANFALGLVFVLSALFLQTIFSYPLLLGTEEVIFVPGILTLLADFLTLGAYTLFLYLSLE